MASIRQILHRKNSSGDYDTIHLQSDMGNVTGTLAVANGGTGQTNISNLKTSLSLPDNTASEIDNLKTSVSSGKALVAAAVTDKGVPTAADATFATIAGNISNISANAYAYITVIYVSGDTCTLTYNGQTETSPDTSGCAVFPVKENGTYTIKTTNNTKGVTDTQTAIIDHEKQMLYIESYTIPDWIRNIKNLSIGSNVVLPLKSGASYSGMENWIIAHKTNNTAVLANRYAISGGKYTKKGTISTQASTYSESSIADSIKSWQSNIDSSILQWLDTVTDNGYSSKAFTCSRASYNSGYDYYKTRANRHVPVYSGGSTISNWTSDLTYAVNYSGNVSAISWDNSCGIRPHIQVSW